jgi:CBS domain-containing protein
MRRWTVGDVMTADVAAVREGAPYKEIVDVLTGRGVSALPVLDVASHVVGVVSETDLVHKVELDSDRTGRHPFEGPGRRAARAKAAGVTARDLMTEPAVAVLASMSIVDAARLMDAERVKRLPVTDDLGRLVGIVTRGDVLKVFLRSDDEIRAEILDEVVRQVLWTGPPKVDVQVHDGVVVLVGELETKSLIPIAVRLAAGVPGVVDVVSRLTYREDDTHLPVPRPIVRVA